MTVMAKEVDRMWDRCCFSKRWFRQIHVCRNCGFVKYLPVRTVWAVLHFLRLLSGRAHTVLSKVVRIRLVSLRLTRFV